MSNVVISLEATCDLSAEIIKEYDLNVFDMDFMIDSNVFSTKTDTVVSTNLYSKMKEGKKTSTSQINEEIYLNHFKSLLSQNKPIIHLALSSGLSNTYLSAQKAAEQLNKENTTKIYVIDSLCACAGQGFLAILLRKFCENETDIEKILEFTNSTKLKINHIFTVDNLKYLANGGRVKPTTAFIGNLLNIKPVLKCDLEGRLIPYSKVISRKKALVAIVDKMAENYDASYTECYISHADCINDALTVSNLIKEKLNVKTIITNLGPVIGCHSGPGTLALFFVGKDLKRL